MENQEIRVETPTVTNELKPAIEEKKIVKKSNQKRKQFRQTLDKLLEAKTLPILELVGLEKKDLRRKKKPDILKKHRGKLLELGKEMQIGKTAKKKLDDLICDKDHYPIIGHGYKGREANFKSWMKSNKRLEEPHIYLWLKRNKCLYVGKAGGKIRLHYYYKSRYLAPNHILKVFFIKRPRDLCKAECLAIHYFNPPDNKNRAAHKKWGAPCPICELEKELDKHLKKLL